MSQFSSRGESATRFEVALIAACIDSGQCPHVIVNSELWLRVASRIGVDSLMVVLDEIGGAQVNVPTRRMFVAELWRPQRDEAIVRLHAAGHSTRAIGRTIGLDHSEVHKVIRRHRAAV